MRKIPTVFVRDETQRGWPVTAVVKPECQWVLDGEGVMTWKLDGHNVKIDAGVLLKRQRPWTGEYDELSYVACDRANPEDRWAFVAFDQHGTQEDGIYELVGPKVQGNPHGFPAHSLIRVLPVDPALVRAPSDGGTPRTFESLKLSLQISPYEGFVFHHPDGRLAKLKRRDFGFSWPVKNRRVLEP